MTRNTEGLWQDHPGRGRQLRLSLPNRHWRMGLCIVAAVISMAGGIDSLEAGEIASPLVISSSDGAIAATVNHQGSMASQMTLAMGTSATVDLNVPVKRTQVTEPDIAAVTVLTPRQLLISGQAVGATQLIIWDEKENRLTINVTVEPNLVQLKAAISRALVVAALVKV